MDRTTELQKYCSFCRRDLVGRSVYHLDGQDRCFRCAVCHSRLVRNSAQTAVVVGTILIVINEGPYLAAGEFPLGTLWKIPLNYLVPFCVASWGALSNTRVDPAKS